MTARVADSLCGLDSRWFTTVLREGGHAEAAVTTISMEPMAVSGAIADMARVRLGYDDSGKAGPPTLIAKIRGAAEIQVAMDGAMGLYDREARFYADLAERVSVVTPRCVHVGDGTRTPLLLEDLGRLRPGDQMQGLAIADAERLMDVLADFHAAFWESPALDADWLASPAEGAFARMITQLVASGVDALRMRYAGRVSDGVLEAVAGAAPRWGEILERCAEGPKTLVHNDCRLDNVFFEEDGTPVIVDWQLVARTRGTQDVGNLLAGSMNAQDLESEWQALLRRYHDRLRARGIGDYSWEACMAHYRQSVLFPLGAGIALLGSMDIGDGRGLGDAIVLRALSHVADVDSFGAL